MEERSGRTWLPWAVLALVVLCGAAVVCGLAGMITFSQRGKTPAPLATQETAAPQEATLALLTPTPTLPSPAPSLVPPVLIGTPIPSPAAPISPENAAQVVQLARWGKGTVDQITLWYNSGWYNMSGCGRPFLPPGDQDRRGAGSPYPLFRTVRTVARAPKPVYQNGQSPQNQGER